MASRKITKLYCVIAIGMTILVLNQYSSNANHNEEERYANQITRYLSSSTNNNNNKNDNINYSSQNSIEQRLNPIKSSSLSSTSASALSTTSTNFAGQQRSSNDLYVVINTPKMGSDGLTSTLVSKGCKDSNLNTIDELKRFDCPDGHTILRAHKFELGVTAVEEHRRITQSQGSGDGDGKCLIVTAIRHPASWFPSYFVQTMGPSYWTGGCHLDKWPSEKALLAEYKDWLHKRTSTYVTLSMALPGLLAEFNGNSLKQQFIFMDRNGGYSELGPAPPSSPVAGCKLLFLRMEESERWPDIFKSIDPTLEFKKGMARIDQCPTLTERLKVITDYEMTDEEKDVIFQNGDSYVRDWLDAYGFRSKQGARMKDQIAALS